MRDHALGQVLDLGFRLDVGAFEEAARFFLGKIGVDIGQQREQFAHPQEARQAGHIGDEGDVFHHPGALGEGILAQDADGALAIGQAQHGIERGGLAGPVMADQAIDAAGGNIEIQPMQDFLAAEGFAQAARRNDGFGQWRKGQSFWLCPWEGVGADLESRVAASRSSAAICAAMRGHSSDEEFFALMGEQFRPRPGFDEHAQSPSFFNDPDIDQRLECLGDRQRIDREFGRDLAHRRQGIALAHRAAQDHADEPLPDLHEDRLAGMKVIHV